MADVSRRICERTSMIDCGGAALNLETHDSTLQIVNSGGEIIVLIKNYDGIYFCDGDKAQKDRESAELYYQNHESYLLREVK